MTNQRARTIAGIGLLFSAGCTGHVPERDDIAEAQNAIIGGNAVLYPRDTGVVQVRPGLLGSITLGFGSRGSGTLLENSIVLTAAHNLDQSNCPYKPAIPGNLSATCRFRPASHAALLGNDNDPTREVKAGIRISVHPRYIPDTPATPDTGVDIAIMRTAAPFTMLGSTSGYSRDMTLQPASNVLNSTLQCFGYGLDMAPAGVSGILNEAPLHVTSNIPPNIPVVPPGVLTLQQTNNAMLFSGDSGGPCFEMGNDKIVSVNRDVVPNGITNQFPNGTLTPLFGRAVHAETFRFWADMVMQSIVDWNVDFDLDGIPDAMFLQPDPQPNGIWRILLLGSSLCQQPGCVFPLPSIPFNGSPNTAAFVAADFNGDGFVDPVFQIDNASSYFAGSPINIGNFLDTNAFFTFLPYNYDSFVVGDFNEDGVADLEARDASNAVDLYLGLQDVGLQPGITATGFPSAKGDDGRFTTLTGNGNQTVGNQKAHFVIAVPGNQPRFDVQIFDGDQSGELDTGGEHTCYRLYADQDEDGMNGVLVAAKRSNDLADQKWSNIYSGPPHIDAQTPSMNFYYYLDAELTDDPCVAGELQPYTFAAVNSYSVRATGDVYVPATPIGYENFTFMGWDTIGPNVPDSLGAFTARDTDYDGTWEMLTQVEDWIQTLTFREADADSTIDDQEPPMTHGPLDIHANGQAIGANAEIGYEVIVAGNNTPIIWGNNPSGNFDPNGGPATQDIEQRAVAITPALVGDWTWKWHDVNAANNIKIWLPIPDLPIGAVGPSTPMASLRVSTQTLRHLPWSTARTRQFWMDHPANIESLLPVTLGTGSQSVNVTQVDTVLLILMQSSPTFGGNDGSHVAVCHSSPGAGAKQKTLVVGSSALSNHLAHGDSIAPTQALAALASELLAAKLNVKGAALNENLAAAYIYGTTLTVGQAIAAADALVRNLEDVCEANATTMLANIERLTRYLRGVNQAKVTNVAPRNTSARRMNNVPIPASPLPGAQETPL